jgi:hypothetical protein
MKKRFKFYLATLLIIFALFASLNFVVADDDDDEDEDEERSSEERDESNSSSGKVETKTTTNVSTKTIIEKDSDGDGLLDGKDPHPEVPEIYIVVDDNRNGIVDQFEK